MMLWKIFSIFFGLSQAYKMHPNFIHLNGMISTCVYHFYECNPNLDSPCCEENNTCTLVYWNDQNLYSCLKTISLDKPCQSNLDCSDLESVICSPEEKVCECSNNYLRVNDHKCASLLDGACVENSDCSVLNSICNNNKCTCKPSYLPMSNNNCKLTALRKSCFADDDCLDANNIVCSRNGICICHGGYQEINNAVCASYLEGYCKQSDDCWLDNSACINNQCECQFGFSPTSHEECQPLPLGKPCLDDTDCIENSPGLNPNNRKYVCVHHNSFGYDFRCASLLENFCTLQRHCLIENSHCRSNTCECKDGFIPKSNRECEPIIVLDESCRSNDDCNEESNHICSNDKECVCKQGYIKVSNRTCAPTLGQLCSETSPCVAINSKCSGKMCRCKANHIPKSDIECVPFWM